MRILDLELLNGPAAGSPWRKREACRAAVRENHESGDDHGPCSTVADSTQNRIFATSAHGWYADPVTGALLDLVDFGLLSIAVTVLLRYSRSVPVLITGTLMIGGWSSNLLDRLGMHYLTAPGSMRGAIDFIPLGRIQYNMADLFIVAGTILFLLTALAASRSTTTTGSRAPTHPRPWARWKPTIAGAACLIAVVGFGTVNYGGVTAPRASDKRDHPPGISKMSASPSQRISTHPPAS